MARYKVSRRAGLMHKGQIISHGTLLPKDNLGMTAKQLEEKVRNGFIVVVGTESEKNDFGPGTGIKTLPKDLKPGEGTTVDPNKSKTKHTGMWMHDPKSLQKLSLEQLNTMVIETDPDIKPFETREEAIAQLSYDLTH